MTAFGTTLLWCALQVTFVSIAAIAAYLLSSRRGATARGGAAMAGLLTAAALTPLAFAPWPHWESRRSAESLSSPIQSSLPSAETTPVRQPDRSLEAIRSNVETVDVWSTAWQAFSNALAEPPQRATETAGPESQRPFRWRVALAWLFVAAAVAGLSRLAVGAWQVRRSIRRAQRIYDPALFGLVDVLRAEFSCTTPVELKESSEVATAATAGWRRPVLLLPSDWRGWTDSERRAVVAHELAHVKRGDYLAAVAAQAALAVHFYHPLLHWLAGRLRLEQELAADALAASVSGGRSEYLRTLAELALRRSDGRVAWPARAFLPSRRTFLRRIEMLRDPLRAADRPAPLLRAATVVGLLLVGVAIAGVRPDPAAAQNAPPDGFAGSPAATAPKREEVAEAAPAAKSPVAFMPAHAQWVVSLGVKAFLNDPVVQPFVGELEKGLAETRDPAWVAMRDAGVNLHTIESLHLGVLPGSEGGADPAAFVVRLTKPIDRAVLDEQASETKATFGGAVYKIGELFASAPDDTTLLLAKDEQILSAMMIGGQINLAASPWTRIEERLGTPVLSVMLDTQAVATQAQKLLTGEGGNPQAMKAMIVLSPVMPLLDDTKLAGLAFTLGEGPGLRGYALADDESAAKRVAETLRAVVTLGQNMLRQLRERSATQPPQEQAMMATFLPIAERLLDTAEVKTEGTDVTLTAEAGDSAAIALGLVLPALQQAREAARRAQSTYNLKQIALAFHIYHDKHGYFPPAVINEKGVMRSWRVELLPHLDQQALYDRYRKNEPWDSEHNKALLAAMPPVYKDPSDPSSPTSTSYFVLTGPNDAAAGQLGEPVAPESITIFTAKPADLTSGAKGTAIRDVFDGTSNTILAVEAKRDVPWTKPEDIPFVPERVAELLEKDLGGNHESGFLAAFADGSVRFIAKAIDPNVLRNLITAAGGEVIGDFSGAPNPPGGNPPRP